MKHKNKSSLFSFTNIVLLITMLAIILVSGTYAKYTSTASGTSATIVANWSFNVNGNNIAVTGDTETVTFDLFNTIKDSDGQNDEEDVATGLIAPGTSGSFEFTVQNTSDVTAQYAIDFTVTKGADVNNANILFLIDGNTWTSDITDITASEETELAMNGGSKTVKVMWAWAYETTAQDSTDTTVGINANDAATDAAKTITVQATLTATQVD